MIDIASTLSTKNLRTCLFLSVKKQIKPSFNCCLSFWKIVIWKVYHWNRTIYFTWLTIFWKVKLFLFIFCEIQYVLRNPWLSKSFDVGLCFMNFILRFSKNIFHLKPASVTELKVPRKAFCIFRSVSGVT